MHTIIFSKLKEYFERNYSKYDIVYAILFGTAATKYFRTDSDIDIAVRFSDNIDEDARLSRISDIIYDLEALFKRSVDVIDVLSAPPALRYEIFVNGKLIFCKDRGKYVEDKATAIMLYLDFKYVEDFHFRRIFDAVSGSKKSD